MKQENTDRSETQGDACQSKNRQEQQLREKSAFINQVTSFAEYMQKEFIEPSDGEIGHSIFYSVTRKGFEAIARRNGIRIRYEIEINP